MKHRWLAVLLTGALVPTGTLRAQQVTVTEPRSSELRGLVYDSLAARPLVGARVSVSGVPMMLTTDRRGRFRVEGLAAGTYVVDVEHDSLDQIGLARLVRRVDVPAARVVDVTLAVPSHATIRRRLCADQQDAVGAADSGIVFGAVRDAESGQRLAGALVRVLWVAVRRGGEAAPIEIVYPARTARTDSLGNYYACGTPSDQMLAVQAFADSATTGETPAFLGPRAVRRHDLSVSRVSVPGGATDSIGWRRGQAALIGRIRSERGGPLADVNVFVDGAQPEMTTAPDGRFVLTRLPAGSQMVSARLIGYSAAYQQVELRSGDTVRMDLSLRELTILDTIQVVAGRGRWSSLFTELDARLRNRVAGQQLQGDQVRRLPNARSLGYQFNGLSLEGSLLNWRLVGQFNCSVGVFIDGMAAGTEILQSYRTADLVAVEYFPRASGAPLWAVSRNTGTRACGVLLVWTRFLR